MFRNLSILAVFIIGLGICEYYGFIWHNSIFTVGYEVKGLDVSHHQGKIDWKEVKKEGKYDFIFLKATEGKDYVDDRFVYNWREAKKQKFLTGAYHFFSMQSSGMEQATHFKHIVPAQSNSLPPVIDVEITLYHDKKKVRDNLQTMLKELEKTYHKKPIIYVTYATYHTYIEHYFKDYHIWIRDIWKYPSIDKSKWILWQYHNRGRVDGITNFVDINVYSCKLTELQQLK
ncbi:glycoside hydrolase [Shimazuella sp. AN120528]|uniref:GH25 family lysozyme n=1 Tax=Shimazuella soli TaxID=1892854 RepID=UPI001F0EDAC9|nr:GH25 family lysozyme [Shimazuella soli]MCH5585601.1 glycoside hydrolase [Shimazuella soli]